MQLFMLIALFSWINKWLLKHDQNLYTKEEIEEMKKKYGGKDDDQSPPRIG